MQLLQWTRTRDDAYAPEKVHIYDAGYDLRIIDNVSIAAGRHQLIDLGIAVAIPPGYVGLLFVRSSAGIKRRLRLCNGTGIIDAGYHGSIKASLTNSGPGRVHLNAGERVVQLVITQAPMFECQEVDQLPDSQRGTGGIGSTGL